MAKGVRGSVSVTQVFVERIPKRRHPYTRKTYMLVAQEMWDELALRLADHSIGLQTMRVYVEMARACDFENRVELGQKDLSARLNMDRSDVSKALKILIDLGFVERPRSVRAPYRMNAEVVWKGSREALQEALLRKRNERERPPAWVA